jgi:hypothetical protein
VVAPRLRAREAGDYSLADLGFDPPGHTLLTVSLTMSFNEEHWKLAAAVHMLS